MKLLAIFLAILLISDVLSWQELGGIIRGGLRSGKTGVHMTLFNDEHSGESCKGLINLISLFFSNFQIWAGATGLDLGNRSFAIFFPFFATIKFLIIYVINTKNDHTKFHISLSSSPNFRIKTMTHILLKKIHSKRFRSNLSRSCRLCATLHLFFRLFPPFQRQIHDCLSNLCLSSLN